MKHYEVIYGCGHRLKVKASNFEGACFEAIKQGKLMRYDYLTSMNVREM